MNPAVHSKAKFDFNSTTLENQTGIYFKFFCLAVQICLIIISTYVIYVIFTLTSIDILMFFLSRFPIKLFMVNKAANGQICSWKDPSDLLKCHAILNPDVSGANKTVMGHLDKVQFLDIGRHVYFDNYYSSPELLNGMFYEQTYTWFIARGNRKTLWETVTKAKPKPEESVLRHNGSMFLLK